MVYYNSIVFISVGMQVHNILLHIIYRGSIENNTNTNIKQTGLSGSSRLAAGQLHKLYSTIYS